MWLQIQEKTPNCYLMLFVLPNYPNADLCSVSDTQWYCLFTNSEQHLRFMEILRSTVVCCWTLFITKVVSDGPMVSFRYGGKVTGNRQGAVTCLFCVSGQVYDGYWWWGSGQSDLLSECAAAKADGTECYIYLQWSVRAQDVDCTLLFPRWYLASISHDLHMSWRH